MKKQISLSTISDELSEYRTRKKEFLELIEAIVPWKEWQELILPYYYKGETGNKPFELTVMLRIHLLQNLYTLSDMGTMTEVIDSRAFSRFCGVDSSNQVPDGDTIGRFRAILVKNGLQEKLFSQVVELLSEKGLILKKGTIVDSTIIESPTSTNNKKRERDPEAHQTKKGNTWHFGYKAHIGVDADTGLAHSLEVTAANVSDVSQTPNLLTGEEDVVYADAGYIGADKRENAKKKNKRGKKIKYKINRKRSHVKKASKVSWYKYGQLRRREREKSSVRSKVEHVFAVVKRLFHYRYTRYKGRRKQTAKLHMMFTLANLYLANTRFAAA